MLTEIRNCNIPKMKRYDHLFEKICDIENLRKAHKNAKKGKGWYKEVQEIDKDPDKYLEQIQEMLINHTYRTSEYEVFYKDDGRKKRKIYKLPYFPDRICQWAILQVIEQRTAQCGYLRQPYLSGHCRCHLPGPGQQHLYSDRFQRHDLLL